MGDLSKIKILVVDDERVIAEAIAMEFGDRGYSTHIEENGKDAYEYVKSSPVHVIISDVQMRGGDGTDLYQKILIDFPQENSRPLFFMVTGYSNLEKEKWLKQGVNGIISKPFNIESIVSDIEKALNSRKSLSA